MYSWVTFKHLSDWISGTLSGSPEISFKITNISTDTRTLKKGDIYLALKGENFDGNKFILEAEKAGASGIIAETFVPTKVPLCVVPDSLKALVKIAEQLRNEFKGPVFAITGSAGKSSTKDMVATLLGEKTVKSPASFNNLLGVSRTLCLLNDESDKLVLEIGMNNFDEITEICKHFKPQIGLITNIGDAHIGKLGGKEGIFKAKKELFDFLAKQNLNSKVALNIDDPLVLTAYEKAFSEEQRKKMPVLTYSVSNPSADVYLKHCEVDPNTGFLDLVISIQNEELPTKLPIYGEHQAQNLVAAISMVRLANVSLLDIKQRITAVRPAYHRGEVKHLKNNIILIDETYNSNPRALLSSLETLGKMDPKRRRCIVIGEMRELGEFSVEMHQGVGDYLVESFKESKMELCLVTVQGHAEEISKRVKAGLPGSETVHLSNVKASLETLPKILKSGDVLLIKGSRGVSLDVLVNSLA